MNPSYSGVEVKMCARCGELKPLPLYKAKYLTGYTKGWNRKPKYKVVEYPNCLYCRRDYSKTEIR